MGWGEVNAADAFAMAMVGVIFAGMSVVLLIVLSIRYHAARQDPAVEALLEEVAAEEAKAAEAAKVPETNPAPAWEREDDWWKK